MSQDVNSDWQNRTFVEGIEMAMRKCIDFLSDFHEQAKYRLSEVDQRLTSLERKVDFVEAQLANADPSQRNAKPKSFEGSTFDPQVRREQVKKFRERLHKTEKVFSDRIIAPKKADGKGVMKKQTSKAKAQPSNQQILGAPKIQGKGNIPIAKLQKQQSDQKAANNASPKIAAAAAPPSRAPGGGPGPAPGQAPGSGGPAPPQPPGNAGPGGGPGAPPGGSPNRPPPSAAEAQKAMNEKKEAPPVPDIPPAAQAAPPQPPIPQPPVPKQPPVPNAAKQPPVPKPPQQPGSSGGEGEGGYGDGPGGGFPHGDPNAIDMHIVQPGSGNVPGGKSKVEIKYSGFLADGSKFIEHQEIISLGLKQNIKGLEAGVQRMQEGTFAKLWIPSKLAYGVRGAPPLIPQNSDLLFEITLLRIVE